MNFGMQVFTHHVFPWKPSLHQTCKSYYMFILNRWLIFQSFLETVHDGNKFPKSSRTRAATSRPI